jgi:hypothetical protein
MTTSVSSTTGTALVVTADSAAAALLVEALRRFAITGEVSNNVSVALYWVMRRKYEAIVIDFGLGPQAKTFYGQVRASASNRTSVTFALTNSSDEIAEALRTGFSFAFTRPLTGESIERTIKAAFGMIVRERRRYFRFPIAVPVVINPRGKSEIRFGETINVSEQGLALRSANPLQIGAELNIEFRLPDENPLAIRADSKVCWHDAKGHSGLSFLFMSSSLASELQAWLARKMEIQFPEDVSRRFSGSS